MNDGSSHNTAVISDRIIQRKLMLLQIFIIFLSVLNGTMFNVSIPDIAGEFRLMPSQVSWVVSGYIILFALGSVTYGKLADIYSIKNLITFGLLTMSAGSLLGLAAQWYPMLIAARLVQAVGGAAIPALAMLIATKYFPDEVKGRVFGVNSSAVAFGAGIGPILGGFVTGTFHWRYLFLFSMLSLLAIPALRRFLPEEAKQSSGFDLRGALFMALGIASLLIFITLGMEWMLPFAVLFALGFVIHIRRHPAPFVSPALFKNKRYRNAVFTGFLATGTVFGMMFVIPLMLRALNSLSAGSIGLTMFPGAISAALLGVIGGRLADRKGSITVVYTALALLAAGYLMLSIAAGLTHWAIALNLILCYIGFSFIQSSLAHTVSGTLPRHEMGIGMGMYNLFTFLSGAFSAAFIGKFLDLSTGRAPFNPLNRSLSAGPYSNLFLLMTGVVLASFLIFHLTFRGKKQANAF